MADEFEDEEYLDNDNEENDPSFHLTRSSNKKQDPKNTTKPKQKSYRKKVERQWTDDEISKLIDAVQLRRALWDFSDPKYRFGKDVVWQEVADALSADMNECKAKWTNLRISFNNCLTKYRKRKSGQGTDESYTVTWKFFDTMMFLEASKVSQSTSSTSNMTLVALFACCTHTLCTFELFLHEILVCLIGINYRRS